MHVVWLIPDYYSFLMDEARNLARHLSTLTILCPRSPPSGFAKQGGRISCIKHTPRLLAVCASERNVLRALKQRQGISLCVRNMKQIGDIASVSSHLRQLCRQGAQVVHSHFAYPAGCGGAVSSQLPHVVSLRGYDVLTTGTYGACWDAFYRRNLRASFEKGAPVLVASGFTRDAARRMLGPDADIRLIPEGIDISSFASSAGLSRSSLRIPSDAVVLMAASNLVPVKNVAMMIRGLAAVAPSRQPMRLLICGTGPEEQSLRDLSQSLGVSDSVMFLGHRSRTELSDLYRLADIFVHASLSEGFGLVVVEAMLHGCIVVAPRVGVAADIIANECNGFLYDVGDIQGFVSSVRKAVLQRPIMGDVLESNRRLISEQFGMAARMSSYLALYRELAMVGEAHA